MQKEKNKIAIIGAGISGLTCAHYLNDFADITIFEKSNGLGGRMATRRSDPFSFDHGAQYFRAQTKAFQLFIQPLLDNNIIAPWNIRFAEFKKYSCIKKYNMNLADGYYVGIPGMNAVGKYLARGLDIRQAKHITSINSHKNIWYLETKNGERFGKFNWVIITTPAPQTLALIPKKFEFCNTIKENNMNSCISLMLGFDKQLDLNFDCAKIIDSDIQLISVNNNKPKRKDDYSLVVQSTHNWANQHMDDNRNYILNHLCQETSRTLKKDMSIASHKNIHIWRYSSREIKKEPTILVDKSSKLAVCGDWCIGEFVESAFISAFNTSSSIKSLISNE